MGGVFINIVKKDENGEKIVKINLSKRFFEKEDLETLVASGIPASWMEDEVENRETIYSIVISE